VDAFLQRRRHAPTPGLPQLLYLRQELAMNSVSTAPVLQEVRIPLASGSLAGDLGLPQHPRGLVLFAHGSGSGRHSARNRQVASRLQQAGVATLLFDLLTPQEEQVDLRTREHRFDIALLTRRLESAAEWTRSDARLRELPLGFFGASTGSAAALIAAAQLGRRVSALVSRGGRPGLAGPAALAAVTAPTLLIVGGADQGVLEENEEALRHLHCASDLEIVSGASHLFEEAGALEKVAELASDWFTRHLARVEHPA
jgi:putative phosphoribosyl transferase